MKNVKMLLEEVLPFYFMLMAIALIFTAYAPTTFELYIVYAFAFGTALYNNRLYKQNTNLIAWRDKTLEVIDVMEVENRVLINQVADLNYEVEWMMNESNRTSISNTNGSCVCEECEKLIQERKENS